MLLRVFLVTLLVNILGVVMGQSISWQGADWERNSHAGERLTYEEDERAVFINWQLRLYDFFKTNSGLSGEVYQHYERISYSTAEAARKHNVFHVKVPAYGALTNVDFRLWKSGVILYEARANSLPTRIEDTIIDPQSGRITGFYIRIPEIEPRTVLEFYYRNEGAAMPYRIGFHQKLPIDTSVVAFRITSNAPLIYHLSHRQEIQFAERQELDKLIYEFKAHSLPPKPAQLGLAAVDTTRKFILVDYARPIPEINGRSTESWEGLLQFLAVPYSLKDYRLFHSIIAEGLGQNMQLSVMQSGGGYFRDHPVRSLLNEEGYAGYLLLSRARLNPFYKLDNRYQRFWKNYKNAPLDTAMSALHSQVNEAIQEYMNMLPPKMFTKYSLIYTFYARFLKDRKASYAPVLIKAEHKEPFIPAFVSYKQFDALGVSYINEAGQRQIVFPGPYLGRFLGINEIPPDLGGASALFFNKAEAGIGWQKLPAVAPTLNAVTRKSHLVIKRERQRLQQKDSLFFKGAFQSPIYHSYLLGDSASDVFTATGHTYRRNYYLQKAKKALPTRTRPINGDTVQLSIAWPEALIYEPRPQAGQSLHLPLRYQFSWQYSISADVPFTVREMDSTRQFGTLAQMRWRVTQPKANEARVRAQLIFFKKQVSSAEMNNYLQLRRVLRQKAPLNIIINEA